jgi:tripartite-type tricarboxylate transporter receptor subunit TctC
MAVVEKSLSYDPVSDFTPISLVGKYGLLMVVNPAVPAKTLPEFLAYARDSKVQINYATSGMGSGLHFAGELFNAMGKVNMTHVPYKGSGPGMQDVLAGVCQVILTARPSRKLTRAKSGCWVPPARSEIRATPMCPP